MKKYFSPILLFLFCLALVQSSFAASSIPKFQVVAQDKTVLAILVPKNTPAEQLKTLISEFRTARKNNTLSKMIPATTRGGQLGDYAIVWIFVFSKADWATADKLQKFINSSLKSAVDKQFGKEYVRHIQAEYFYSPLEEYGNLGYDDGIVRSPNYKKLF
ncbi:MAG: hypothetical protein Q8J64_06900 [Thermodesulfovibrionales bacterium]|nr:hypothetical protein [Thermodesulfovibrionales bacterium]